MGEAYIITAYIGMPWMVMVYTVMAMNDQTRPPKKCSLLHSSTATYIIYSVMTHVVMAYIVTAYIVMADEVKAYIGMAYVVMAHAAMAYVVMAYVVMAYIVMACIVLAHIVMAYIVMAYIRCVRQRGCCGSRLATAWCSTSALGCCRQNKKIKKSNSHGLPPTSHTAQYSYGPCNRRPCCIDM